MAGRPTLGLLVDWLDYDYQSSVLSGVADAVRQYGANLICFTGGVLGSPYRGGAQRNHIYELASSENVDALMLMSGTLGNFLGPEELAKFCERFQPLPMCSIALELPGIPSVLVDNDTGMRDAITHLIQVHGYKRIAMIRGPELNAEAERRFRVYSDVLGENGITVDQQLVTSGDFRNESGREAIRTLFDARQLGPGQIDAIVAANDQMAIGALEELEQRGVRVPEHVSLVGFDDIEEARYASPPLTTVRQPLADLGKQAVRLVTAQLEGQKAENVTLRTELVTRRSCRCFAPEPRAPSAPGAAGRVNYAVALNQARVLITSEMSRASRSAFDAVGEGWESRLLDAFIAQLRGDSEEFLETFEEITQKVLDAGSDLGACQEVISALRREALSCLENDPIFRARAEDMLQEVRVVAANAIERGQAQMRLRVERWARSLSETGAALITTFDIAHLVQTVAEQFPLLGITGCYISLYQGDTVPAKSSKLVLAFNSDGLLKPAAGRDVFPTRELAPRELLPLDREHAYVVEPLFFKQDQLGFALFELGPSEGRVYEALRDQISAALKGAISFEQVLETKRERDQLLKALEQASAPRVVRPPEDPDAPPKSQGTEQIVKPLQELSERLVELQDLVTDYRESDAGREAIVATRSEFVAEVQKVINAVRLAAERASGVARSIHKLPNDKK